MKIYVGYILKSLAAPTAFVTVSLVSVVWLTQSLRFIDLIINQGLPVMEFIQLVTLLLPSLFGLVMPIALLCATLFTYNKLNNESEIMVLKAAGVSRFGIAKPTVILAIFVMILGYIVSLYLLPVSYRHFKDKQYYFRDNYASLMLEEGIFNTPIEGLMIYVKDRASDNTLKGILVHDTRTPGKPVTMLAETASIERGPTGLRFIMQNASRQQVDKRTGEVNMLYFDSYPFDIGFFTSADNNRNRKTDELFLDELFNPNPTLPDKQRYKQIAEGHNRLVWPLNNLSLPLGIMAIMLSGDFNRRGQSRRIITCAVGAALLIIINIMFRNLAADGKATAIVLMYVPSISVILVSLYVLLIGKNPFAMNAVPAHAQEAHAKKRKRRKK